MKTTTALSSKRIVIILLLAEAIAVTVPVILLGKYFNFPTILTHIAAIFWVKVNLSVIFC